MIFTYRPYTQRAALALNECCITAAETGWMLHFYGRAADGRERTYHAPINPNGTHTDGGPLGRTWGLTRCGAGEWQVSPSIDFGDWHHTPKIVGVPEGEPWQ